jgi:hypothetical protein
MASFPCGKCFLECEGEKTIACDNCDKWFHQKCKSLSNIRYSFLEARDIHDEPRLGLKELNLDYSLRIWSQPVNIVCNSSVLKANHECPSILYEFPLSCNLCLECEGEKTIACDNCDKWFHQKCKSLSNIRYSFFFFR